jgi:hypothetical protein
VTGLLTPHRVADIADALAPALSDGRRRRARLVMAADVTYVTDLRTVFVPYPPPAPERGLRAVTCGIALQAAPTKEMVSALPVARLSPRERRALGWAEGRAALGWSLRRWPGLGSDLSELLPAVAPDDPDIDAGTLMERALQIARSQRNVPHPPSLLGSLPHSRTPAVTRFLKRRAKSRMPWSTRRTLARVSPLSIPVAGRGGEQAPRSGPPAGGEDEDLTGWDDPVGIPYDEWDVRTGTYRRGFVTVLELPAPPGDGMARGRAEAIWIRQSPDRTWHRRLDDGTDVDIDAFIDEHCRALHGDTPSGRVYSAIAPGPRDLATALLLDASASLGVDQGHWLGVQLACADAMAAGMADSGEPHGVYAFSGDTRHRVHVRVLREFGTATPRPPSATRLRPDGYTRLGAPLRHLTRKLLAVPAGRRVLLAIGDGLPSDDGYEGDYAEADVARAVEEATGAGIVVFYIGVGRVRRDPLPTMFGSHRSLRIGDLNDLPEALAAIYEGLRD